MYVHIDLHRRPKHWLQDTVQLKLCEQNGQSDHKTDNPLPINGARNDMSFDRYGPQPNQLDCPFSFVRSNPEGQYQATGHAHVLSNMIDFGMDPQEAIDAPRVFPETYGLRIEDNLSQSTRDGLQARGHKLVQKDDPIGGAQAIRIDHATGTLIGGSDPRKDGIAIGY